MGSHMFNMAGKQKWKKIFKSSNSAGNTQGTIHSLHVFVYIHEKAYVTRPLLPTYCMLVIWIVCKHLCKYFLIRASEDWKQKPLIPIFSSSITQVLKPKTLNVPNCTHRPEGSVRAFLCVNIYICVYHCILQVLGCVCLCVCVYVSSTSSLSTGRSSSSSDRWYWRVDSGRRRRGRSTGRGWSSSPSGGRSDAQGSVGLTCFSELTNREK